jgi:hypothetical protein
MHAFDQPDRPESGRSRSAARSGGRGRDSDSNSPAVELLIARVNRCGMLRATYEGRKAYTRGADVGRVRKENTQVFLTYENVFYVTSSLPSRPQAVLLIEIIVVGGSIKSYLAINRQ